MNNRTPEQETIQKLSSYMSPAQLKKLMVQDDGKLYLKTINAALVGTANPHGVSYTLQHTIICGVVIYCVGPSFTSYARIKLPSKLILASDRTQFAYLNRYLAEHPEKISASLPIDQRQIIRTGQTPQGLLWHHEAEFGIMSLVDATVHSGSRHTGGKAIWGGGNSFR